MTFSELVLAKNLVVHALLTDGLLWKQISLPNINELERRPMQFEILFITGLLLVAFLYASVGHGGASAYLALMALFNVMPDSIRLHALILNMFVSGIAFISYSRAGFFRWRFIWPFLIGSIPAAYLGAHISIDQHIYKIILGIFLIIAVLRLLLPTDPENKTRTNPPLLLALGIGIALGFISGIIGIGGGILLSPILILAGYASTKEASAASSLFIFLNSASGLAGLPADQIHMHPHLFIWILVVIGAGFAGSSIGSHSLPDIKLRMILSVVLLTATFKLFFY